MSHFDPKRAWIRLAGIGIRDWLKPKAIAALEKAEQAHNRNRCDLQSASKDQGRARIACDIADKPCDWRQQRHSDVIPSEEDTHPGTPALLTEHLCWQGDHCAGRKARNCTN